jgi:hypothetical protein
MENLLKFFQYKKNIIIILLATLTISTSLYFFNQYEIKQKIIRSDLAYTNGFKARKIHYYIPNDYTFESKWCLLGRENETLTIVLNNNQNTLALKDGLTSNDFCDNTATGNNGKCYLHYDTSTDEIVERSCKDKTDKNSATVTLIDSNPYGNLLDANQAKIAIAYDGNNQLTFIIVVVVVIFFTILAVNCVLGWLK